MPQIGAQVDIAGGLLPHGRGVNGRAGYALGVGIDRECQDGRAQRRPVCAPRQTGDVVVGLQAKHTLGPAGENGHGRWRRVVRPHPATRTQGARKPLLVRPG